MALWSDIATWIGPTVNEGDGDGRPGEPEDAISTILGVVLHIQDGSEAGTEAWQKNPDANVSSHFLAPKAGRGRQMVDTADRAWAQVAGNSHWLSIECEGWTGASLTADQIETCSQLLARAHQLHSVPLVSTDSVNVGGLGWHGMGGADWGGHYDCPGEPIKAQRPLIIQRAKEILAMTDRDLEIAEARLEAQTQGLDNVRYGQTAGEPMWIVRQLKANAQAISELQAALAALKPLTLAPGTKLTVTVDNTP